MLVTIKANLENRRYNFAMHYRHTQPGTLTKIILSLSIVFCFVVAAINQLMSPVAYSMYGMIALLIGIGWLFGSLTVEVDDEELRHWFGPGFWKKSYSLHEIESAEHVRNSWIFGWGIRLTPHGWLYNVSGLDAVQVHLRSGRKFRIGTDDPQGLLASILQETT